MISRTWSWLALLGCLLLTGGSLAAELPDHPAKLAPLTPESTFPRYTPEELAAAGYPDHLHMPNYGGFEPMVAADGETYGRWSLAQGTMVKPREGLIISPGSIQYRGIHLHYNAGYAEHHMLPMIEVLDWAWRDLAILLDHDRADTLQVINPDDLDEYRVRTGYAFHRLYGFVDGGVVIEPAPILFSRSLAAHAAHHLMAVWLLDDLAGGAVLPAWLVQGLASYLAEDGVHFLNYLAMYRSDESVLMSPAQAEAILGGPADPDANVDKMNFRKAGYTSFLMAWELVENRGGLAPVRSFFARVGQGEDPDQVSRELFGHDLDALATELDPAQRPEPVGDAIQPRSPQRPPSP